MAIRQSDYMVPILAVYVFLGPILSARFKLMSLTFLRTPIPDRRACHEPINTLQTAPGALLWVILPKKFQSIVMRQKTVGPIYGMLLPVRFAQLCFQLWGKTFLCSQIFWWNRCWLVIHFMGILLIGSVASDYSAIFMGQDGFSIIMGNCCLDVVLFLMFCKSTWFRFFRCPFQNKTNKKIVS